jgi:two-component system CheB/CheR fusion protein
MPVMEQIKMRGTKRPPTDQRSPVPRRKAQGRVHATSNDLQNVLYSTDVATIFLDRELNIRLFTPATKSLFRVIPGDIGRPLADLHSLASDATLLADARAVLLDPAPIEREIVSTSGIWFIRRILPCRAGDGAVEGVVITFTDVTERKHIALALEAAKLQAEQATIAKSRFLAAASHDLRQPLQTLALLQGLLAKTVDPAKVQKLVVRLDETLATMSGMLNTLLDINQIEAGIVKAEIVRFPIDDLLGRLREEYADRAESEGVSLRVVGCGLEVASDRHLLEQMLRNLVSNALKYTKCGKVLVGCRRRAGMLSIEVLDTGIGIPETEFEAIFEEYHQLDNAARERSRGLGLGLSIVKRLGTLLGHTVRVASRIGKGSMFAIDIRDSAGATLVVKHGAGVSTLETAAQPSRRAGSILVVEDDPEVRGLLELLLAGEGHRVTIAADGVIALDLVERRIVRPDLILADYNLPNGLDGLQIAAKVRENLRRLVPVVILTGDITTGALRRIAQHNCVRLNKPVKTQELVEIIQRLLPLEPSAPSERAPLAGSGSAALHPVVYIVDDDDSIRGALRSVLEAEGHAVEDYGSGEAFLAVFRPGGEGCLLVDAGLPGISGLELLQHLKAAGSTLPAIMITGRGDVPMAVEAMKAGVVDFAEKPVGAVDLAASVERALDRSKDSNKLAAWQANAVRQIGELSVRQRQVMDMVLAGHPSKNIAADLGISQRTVENHRAAIMDRTGAASLPALARLALAASQGEAALSTGRS